MVSGSHSQWTVANPALARLSPRFGTLMTAAEVAILVLKLESVIELLALPFLVLDWGPKNT